MAVPMGMDGLYSTGGQYSDTDPPSFVPCQGSDHGKSLKK